MNGLSNGSGSSAMTIEERKKYITRNLQEVLGEDRLESMLTAGGDFNVSLLVYIRLIVFLVFLKLFGESKDVLVVMGTVS